VITDIKDINYVVLILAGVLREVVSVKTPSSAARTLHKLVFDTERIEHHGNIQPRSTSTENAHRELGNERKKWGRNDQTRIDRRPGLLWVRVSIDEAFDGVLSGLSQCLRAGVCLGWRDFALDDIDCDQPTNSIAIELSR
jgi:hypothetical protein